MCHKTYKNLTLHKSLSPLKYEIHIPSADGQPEHIVESACHYDFPDSNIIEVVSRPPLASKGDGEYTIVRNFLWHDDNTVGWKHIIFTVITVKGKKKITKASYTLSRYNEEKDYGVPLFSPYPINLKNIKVIFH